MRPGIDEPPVDAVCQHCGRRLTCDNPPYCGACAEEGQRYLELAADWDEHSSDVDPGRAK